MVGLERREVLDKCRELGIPVFHGEIDKTLFLAGLREQAPEGGGAGQPQASSSTPTSVAAG